MFKLLRKPATNRGVVAEHKDVFGGKTTKEVVEEIHETFYTEVDRLLASAKISNSLETDKQDLIDKSRRLKEIGFHGAREVGEANAEAARLYALEQENEEKRELVEAIKYFSFKYPNHKFITEKSVKKICEKYNLVYGTIDRYTGSVPDKNLRHIEDFSVSEDDECFSCKEIRYISFSRSERVVRTTHITHERVMQITKDIERTRPSDYREEIEICPLEIAAPSKDFRMEGMEVKEHKLSKIEIPDPIVLKPVIFNGKKHYLIITAWGLEAGDELVVNANHN